LTEGDNYEIPAIRCLLAVVSLFVMSLPGSADTEVGTKAYLAKDFDTAFLEFTKSANQGDMLAKRYLANMYFLGQGTAKDEVQGTKLAHECAEAGDSYCYLMYAKSNLSGLGIAVNYAEARIWARKGFAGGVAGVWEPAGVLLEQIYLINPANRFLVDGKRDMEKYNALARRTLEQRAEQVEALEALAASAQAGFVPARLLLSTVLFDSGAGTAEKICSLLAGINDLPERFQKYLTISQQVAQLGPTRASPKLVMEASQGAAEGAMGQASRAGIQQRAACKDFKVLKFLGATPIDHATWLPLTQPLLANTYPLTGAWSEDWSVSLCGRVSTVNIQFTADGMGGANFHMGPF